MVLRKAGRAGLGLGFCLVFLVGGSGGARAEEPAVLSLTATTSAASSEDLRAGGSAWSGIAEQVLHLNRTPPLYEGDPLDDGYRPAARVALVRSGGALFVRLSWSDSTESRPAEPQRLPDGGEAGIYKQHSRDIERFADAACIMVPKATGRKEAFPGLMMGDREAPVDLYYWNLVKGFERMEAAGRSTTSRTGQNFPGAARYAGGTWEVVFELPLLQAGTPLSFAVWDGNRSQRDGLKYYTLWYEVAS